LTAFNRGDRQLPNVAHHSPRPDTARANSARPKLGPPWLRSRAVDPVTFRPVPQGEVGLLSFFDLANAGSVSAIVTEDLGIVDGEAVYVLGRSGGDARGCALGIEQFAGSHYAGSH
jgi:hypothetical protein